MATHNLTELNSRVSDLPKIYMPIIGAGGDI